jgi:glycogen operon protein
LRRLSINAAEDFSAAPAFGTETDNALFEWGSAVVGEVTMNPSQSRIDGRSALVALESPSVRDPGNESGTEPILRNIGPRPRRTGEVSSHFAARLLLFFFLIQCPATAQIDRLALGARFSGDKSHLSFRIYSSRATRIELYLYAQPTGADEVAHLALDPDPVTSVWSISLPLARIRQEFGIAGPIYYGFRVWGPNWPFDPAWTKGAKVGFLSDVDSEGNRFNPNKLLYDPYARELSHDPVTREQPDGTIYASGPDHFLQDTGREAPKGIVLENQTGDTGPKPLRPLKDDIIYEVHLRGLTEQDSMIAPAIRGTYAGAAAKAPALANLGITAIEFLPVQETQNDANGLDPRGPDGDNYWGYATLDYFAPDRRYSSDKSPGGPTREFQAMVRAFHNLGIKVFIDVVYNHTGEGYAYHGDDPRTYNLLSWRGLDNPTYYALSSDHQFSFDKTGVGGDYNTANPVAQDLIVDSLAWWRDALGVDGFRFDLAAVLGDRCQHGCFLFDKLAPETALNRIVRDLAPRPSSGGPGIDLIAEPWAVGEGTYQLGGFPAGWSEWNGAYRDQIRRSQNKLGVEAFTTGQLAMRLTGSADLFQGNGRRPWNSINFVVAHDGFTLADLYRFNAKNNNQPYPAGPSDGGSDDNLSWDQGGNASDQRKAARNGVALLLLSAGTPMMTGGDEFLRSLNGNNNPYNLDTGFNWLNYDLSDQQKAFREYVSRLIDFRRHHPALRPTDFYTSAEVRWFRPDGTAADAEYFDNPDNHAIAWTIDGSAFADPSSQIYIAYNAWSGAVTFRLPSPGDGKIWFRTLDTSTFLEPNGNMAAPGAESRIEADDAVYTLGARAVLILLSKQSADR